MNETEEEEGVEYKPIPVKTLLTEIKDLSELMLDLAYSAVLFHDEDIAEEVHGLEERVDYLGYLLLMQSTLAARDRDDAEQTAGVITVASAVDKISDAAADIANLVLLDLGVHPSVREAFKKVEERLVKVKISPKSLLAGKTLQELNLQTTIGIDVIAIRRGKNWTINPGYQDILTKGDVVIARGSDLGTQQLRDLASGELEEIP